MDNRKGVGDMTITIDDMRRVLRGEPKAEMAIFWMAYAWHSGKGSDLYRVLCESPYIPPERFRFDQDPDIVRLFGRLEWRFQPEIEAAYQPVKIDDVEDGDILIAGKTFLCIQNRWPCRVFTENRWKCVACKDGAHRLRADDAGFVIGFRR
jgi:hypothetical protein